MNLVDQKSAFKSLKSGLPIIFPTDTLPAIGCLPKFSNIIYEFKKRDKNKPLILMGSEQNQLIDFVHESAKRDYEKIASKYWPGALTMVVPSAEKQTLILTSKDFSLGLRIPKSHVALSLMKETGPLLTSSANISGFNGSMRAEHRLRQNQLPEKYWSAGARRRGGEGAVKSLIRSCPQPMWRGGGGGQDEDSESLTARARPQSSHAHKPCDHEGEEEVEILKF